MLVGRRPGRAGGAPGAPGQQPQRVLGMGREGRSRAARAVPDLVLSVAFQDPGRVGLPRPVGGRSGRQLTPCKGRGPEPEWPGRRAVGRTWGGGSQTGQTPGSGSFTEAGLSSKS